MVCSTLRRTSRRRDIFSPVMHGTSAPRRSTVSFSTEVEKRPSSVLRVAPGGIFANVLNWFTRCRPSSIDRRVASSTTPSTRSRTSS